MLRCVALRCLALRIVVLAVVELLLLRYVELCRLCCECVVLCFVVLRLVEWWCVVIVVVLC